MQTQQENSYSIEGIVVDEHHNPIPEVSVIIHSSPTQMPDLALITNTKGEFSFSSLPKGEYSIQFITEKGSQIESYTIVDQDLVVEFTLASE